jgi:hypothetical protein
MKQFSFTIEGNQDDPLGNAIPKIRKTYRQQWTPEAQRYTAWKGFIQEAFLRSLVDLDFKVHIRFQRLVKKPIKLTEGEKGVMDICIFWKDETHGDPENIFGSIADALFYNDKNLDGSFKSELAKDGKGRVEIIININ